MAKMVDMKRSKKDRKKDTEPSVGGGSDYHYGLRVSLGDDELQKLGMSDLPKVGDKLHLHSHAHVVSVSQDQNEGGKKNRHVSLELRKMALEKKGPEDATDNDDESVLAGGKAAMDEALNG